MIYNKPTEDDWTLNLDTGQSNSSQTYNELKNAIERMIRSDAHMLISGRADDTAGLILSQLAHKYGLIPTEKTRQVLDEE